LLPHWILLAGRIGIDGSSARAAKYDELHPADNKVAFTVHRSVCYLRPGSVNSAASYKLIFMQAIWRFVKSETGATAIEYAVLLGLILLACITALMLVGQSTATSYSNSSNSIQSAIHGGN
jgi:pilus assembly protein Flp/PilA